MVDIDRGTAEGPEDEAQATARGAPKLPALPGLHTGLVFTREDGSGCMRAS